MMTLIDKEGPVSIENAKSIYRIYGYHSLCVSVCELAFQFSEIIS